MTSPRIAIVTGAGRGLGRAHARALAHAGYSVVVNDNGSDVNGRGTDSSVADAVAAEIREMGADVVANYEDVSDWEGAQRMVQAAVDTFGGLDVLVNNAGILRDRMLVNMTSEDWDEVMRVHLRGTFAPTRWAATYWRERDRAGHENDARVINTSSPSGLYGNVGQTNYGAAKAGVAAFTIIAATELARYGVTVNALAPGARTRMTENLPILASVDSGSDAAFDSLAPENVAPVVVWLAGPESRKVTGRVFNIWGGQVSVAEGWHAGPGTDRHAQWEVEELADVLPDFVDRATPNADTSGVIPKT